MDRRSHRNTHCFPCLITPATVIPVPYLNTPAPRKMKPKPLPKPKRQTDAQTQPTHPAHFQHAIHPFPINASLSSTSG